MTLVNAWIRGNAVHLMSDGVEYSPLGIALTPAQKIFTFGPMRTALACRGVSALVPSLGLAIYNRFSCFDSLVDEIGSLTREVIEGAAQINPALADEPFELVVAGWSDADDAPDLAMVLNTGPHPWMPLECGDTVCSPGDPDAVQSWASAGIDPTAADFDPLTEGVRLAEAQRRITAHVPGTSGRVALIGGALELVSITREDVRSRVLKRWPDRIGEKISLEANAPVARIPHYSALQA